MTSEVNPFVAKTCFETIPEGWETRTISQLADIYLGGTPKTKVADYWNGPIEWVTAKDVSNTRSRFVLSTERTITQKGIDSSASKILPANTIIITARGVGVGDIRILSKPMAFNQTCYGLKAKAVNDVFLFYKLKSILGQIRMFSYGTVFTTITMRTFDQIEVAVPVEKREQLAIAKILSAMDSRIELNQKMNITIESIAQALFRRWFVDFEFPNEEGKPYKSSGGEMVDSEFGLIPVDWSVLGSISEMCDKINYGYTQSATTEEVGPKFLRVMDINKADWIDWSTVPFCEIDEKSKPKYILNKKDIVIARMADPGKIAIFEADLQAVFASYLIRIRLKTPTLAYYLYYLMKSAYYQDFIEGAATGSVQKNLNAKALTSGLPIVIPSKEIVLLFDSMVESLRTRINQGLTESTTLSRIRDALLPKLMSGKIRVPVEKNDVGST